MIREITIYVMLLSLLSGCGSRKKDEKDDSSLDSLGKRVITALSNEDREEYISCWVPIDDFITLLRGAKYSMLSEGEIPQFRKDYEEARETALDWFDRIISGMQAEGIKPDSIRFHSVDARVYNEFGIESTSDIKIYFTSKDKPGDLYYVDTDDAYKVNGKWYFTDALGPGIEKEKR
jgi:hypothetical protein